MPRTPAQRPRLAPIAGPVAATATFVAAAVAADRAGHPLPALAAAVAAVGVHALAAARGYRRERAAGRLAAAAASHAAAIDVLENIDALRAAELADAERVSRRLWHLGQAVTAELDPQRALQRFVAAAADVAQADGAALALVEGDALRVTASAGFGDALVGETLPRVESAMGRAVTSGLSWRHPDVTATPAVVHAPAAARLASAEGPVRGIMVVPVARRGERFGALALLSRVPRHFTDAEVERVEALADMLSVALANAELVAELRQAERLAAVGELVAGVAHEVNNPLSSVSAFAQLLLRDGGLSESQRDSLGVIRDEASRAAEVVRDLLAFARKSGPAFDALDLNALVERTLRLVHYQVASGQVYVELTLEPDLPAVAGDARQLQQVVFNLVTNALQAMAPLGRGTLRVATRGDGDRVELEVSDTGAGVAPAARERVFEPFYTTKAEGEGTGLGLSVSYGIVAAHGGTLRLARTSVAGATFLMALPAAGDPPAAAHPGCAAAS